MQKHYLRLFYKVILRKLEDIEGLYLGDVFRQKFLVSKLCYS